MTHKNALIMHRYVELPDASQENAIPLHDCLKTLEVKITNLKKEHIMFYAIGPSGERVPLWGVNKESLRIDASTQGQDETWVFDVRGLTKVAFIPER